MLRAHILGRCQWYCQCSRLTYLSEIVQNTKNLHSPQLHLRGSIEKFIILLRIWAAWLEYSLRSRRFIEVWYGWSNPVLVGRWVDDAAAHFMVGFKRITIYMLYLCLGTMTTVYSERFREYVLLRCSKPATAALGHLLCWRAEETSRGSKKATLHVKFVFTFSVVSSLFPGFWKLGSFETYFHKLWYVFCVFQRLPRSWNLWKPKLPMTDMDYQKYALWGVRLYT